MKNMLVLAAVLVLSSALGCGGTEFEEGSQDATHSQALASQAPPPPLTPEQRAACETQFATDRDRCERYRQFDQGACADDRDNCNSHCFFWGRVPSVCRWQCDNTYRQCLYVADEVFNTCYLTARDRWQACLKAAAPAAGL